MTVVEALFLGLIQGLTEFLPISSSGHLWLAQYFLGLGDPRDYLLFDLVCHAGTLLAVVVLYFSRLLSLFREERKTLWNLAVATSPLSAALFLMPIIKQLYGNPQWMGIAFLTTALLLWSCHSCREGNTTAPRWWNAWIVGCFQLAALLPGISRSGATLTGACLMGWRREEALAFSFLLAIPAILGGLAFELFRCYLHGEIPLPSVTLLHYAVGFFTSFFVGSGAIALATHLVLHHRISYFAWYCLLLAMFCFWHFAQV